MPDLLETVEDGIATLTLNRPENLNALSDDIRNGMVEALTRLGADPAIGEEIARRLNNSDWSDQEDQWAL